MSITGEFVKGIYLHDGFIFEPKERCPFYWKYEDWERYLNSLAFMGINAIQFATQASFLRIPSTIMEFNRIETMKKVIRHAHQIGMEVWYTASTNVLSNIPDGIEPKDQLSADAWGEPCPRDAERRKKILEVESYFFEQYKEADVFEVFAGDWGGCNCGVCDYHDYLEFAKDYFGIIMKVNPNAEVRLNTWAVAYWQAFDKKNPDWRKVFDDEARLSVKVMEELDNLPAGIGIDMPFHNLYRPLAINGRDEAECPPWPDKQKIDDAKRKGHKVFAWPHFIMENDPLHPGRWGFMHARVAYLRDIVSRLKQRGVDGIMGNLYNPQYQPLSTYAFAQLAGDAGSSDEKILRDFAALIVAPNDVDKLYDILSYLENNDPWEADLPASWRKKHVECRIGRSEASELAAVLVPLDTNPGNLLLMPVECLKVIESTLEQLPDEPLVGSLC